MPSAEQAVILQWVETIVSDNPVLLEKVLAVNGIKTEESAKQGLAETIKFLVLCSKQGAIFTPSRLVDQVWHEFILFTRTYQAFCEQHLGGFIHHQPSNDKTANNQQYLATLTAYQLRYGAPLADFWPDYTEHNADCGTCEN